MGRLSILDETGDTKVEWNPDNKEEVAAAKKSFEDYKDKGFKAYRQYDAGKPGTELKDFDKFAEKVLFVPPLKGGNAALANLR